MTLTVMLDSARFGALEARLAEAGARAPSPQGATECESALTRMLQRPNRAPIRTPQFRTRLYRKVVKPGPEVSLGLDLAVTPSCVQITAVAEGSAAAAASLQPGSYIETVNEVRVAGLTSEVGLASGIPESNALQSC